MAGDRDGFEFQRLHGMGEALHETVRKAEGTRCRIYAPVGAHSDLLAYLVRRLLENGANSSFVHQIADEDVDAARPSPPIRSPRWRASTRSPNPAIRRPARSFAPRRNSAGWNINDPASVSALIAARAAWHRHHWQRRRRRGRRGRSLEPGRPRRHGRRPSTEATPEAVATALAAAPRRLRRLGGAAGGRARARSCARAADLYEAQRRRVVRAGHARGRQDAGRRHRRSARGGRLPALLRRRGRRGGEPAPSRAASSSASRPGISRWRSSPARSPPRSVTGNAVIAKPAEQTPLIAARAVELLHEAGVPEDVAAAPARRRPVGRRAADRRSAHRRRLLHRLDRGGAGDRAARSPRPPRPTRC